MRLTQTLQPGLKHGDRSSRSISSGSLSRESRVKRFVRRLAHIDDMHRPVFPENARSNRLFVLVARHPYYHPSSLQVVASPDKFLVFVADLTEGAVDTSPQSVVLTRYIETFSTCRTSQHVHLVSRKAGTSEVVQNASHCIPVGNQCDQIPRRILEELFGWFRKLRVAHLASRLYEYPISYAAVPFV